jgi:hypothetical protein
MWALIQDCDLPVTFHVSTGRDPRAARHDGGAVINYAAHSLAPTIEPVASLCASGVIERFPKLRFAAIESGIGWVPWALTAMDEAYRKHHLWAFPKLKHLPSEYFRSNGAASFQEDPAGLALAERFDLVDNFLWANDYPHAEGTWPHSAEAIEREMGALGNLAREDPRPQRREDVQVRGRSAAQTAHPTNSVSLHSPDGGGRSRVFERTREGPYSARPRAIQEFWFCDNPLPVQTRKQNSIIACEDARCIRSHSRSLGDSGPTSPIGRGFLSRRGFQTPRFLDGAKKRGAIGSYFTRSSARTGILRLVFF